MQEYITVGCDLHDRSMLLKIARGREEAKKRSFSNDAGGRVCGRLCQAAWATIRSNPPIRDMHERLLARNPKKKKISQVGVMRRLVMIRKRSFWLSALGFWPCDEHAYAEPRAWHPTKPALPLRGFT